VVSVGGGCVVQRVAPRWRRRVRRSAPDDGAQQQHTPIRRRGRRDATPKALLWQTKMQKKDGWSRRRRRRLIRNAPSSLSRRPHRGAAILEAARGAGEPVLSFRQLPDDVPQTPTAAEPPYIRESASSTDRDGPRPHSQSAVLCSGAVQAWACIHGSAVRCAGRILRRSEDGRSQRHLLASARRLQAQGTSVHRGWRHAIVVLF
jgi:hypothetical protein